MAGRVDRTERVRLSADVEPELRRRVRIAAARSDRKVSDWISGAVQRELEREELLEEALANTPTNDAGTTNGPNGPNASVQAFARDWDSEDDAVYDEIEGPGEGTSEGEVR